MLGAIVIVGPAAAEEPGHPSATMPLSCVDILGQSVLGRTLADLRSVGVDSITVLGDHRMSPLAEDIEQAASGLLVKWVQDAWCAATQVLQTYKDCNIETTFIFRAGAYAEFDTQEILEFHRAKNQSVTRVFDAAGAIDFWIVSTDHLSETTDLGRDLAAPDAARYAFCSYVNRLVHTRDLRSLVIDSFSARCRLRPFATEVRPGLWIGDATHIHRKARIVAPAFLGFGSKIEEKCLITRGCNVERNAEIDYGTVVENSSVLANSYVGIGLDITHSIVDGNCLHNLKRNVTMEIADAGIVRRLTSFRNGKNQSSPVVLGLVQHSICA